MRIVTIAKGKYAGDYEVYQFGEENCPKVKDRRIAQVGDWIQDDNGVVAKVLDARTFGAKASTTFKPDKAKLTNFNTCFGIDYSHLVNRMGEIHYRPLDFTRERSYRGTLTIIDKDKLSIRDRQFVVYLVTSGNMHKAFELAFSDKNYNDRKKLETINRIFKVPEAKELIRNMLREIAQAKGLDNAEFFLQKLMESVEGKIGNEFQLALLAMLAEAGGNTEIIRLFDKGDSNSLPRLPVPSNGNGKHLPEPVQANYTEELKTGS